MAPKKSKKIPLNEFLGDSTLGSWADEMESLPNAPAARIDEEPSDLSSKLYLALIIADRQHLPPREDVPLPSQPPYTAFVGNLAFDLTESELGQFFSGAKTKSVKIIKDRDDKPKGFGYVEFEDLEGLKDALSKSGSNFSGRVIRVSVAEPPKERSGFGGPSDDNSKFDNPWRRDGPLPDTTSREPSRRRFDGPPHDRHVQSASDGPEDWRSNRPQRVPDNEPPSFKRKGSGFLTPEGTASSADKEEVWAIGSKFKPSGPGDESSTNFGSTRSRGDMGPPKETPSDEAGWRSATRGPKRGSVSPTNSTPPTPQLARRKLELLPRSGNASVSPSPLSSPKMAPTPPTSAGSRPNPFGGARPVDVSSREKAVEERIEKERESVHEKVAMSRTSSRSGVERGALHRPQTPPVSSAPNPKVSSKPTPVLAPTVRPSLSFANVAAKKESAASMEDTHTESTVDQVADDVANVAI
ncbi:hypothetical protein NLJ89_g3135 [Agrocybe chaxingu]|uniref:RRM domain-containing protein n=1 Tax=Agrocybe chaxingu TaxID=84603 RepID=A0A9W8MX40_9AGAR|nr:hypothetical protein NLJ89_g3135 [Agrocybe chaxingu]